MLQVNENLIKLRELYFQRAVQQSKESFIHQSNIMNIDIKKKEKKIGAK